MKTEGLKVSTPSDCEIVMTRDFNGSQQQVWRAMTDSALVRRWLFAPSGWFMSICQMDVRVGGEYVWQWKDAAGLVVMTIRGVYKEVEPFRRIVHTERMEMGACWASSGERCEGAAESCGEDALSIMELSERGTKTILQMTMRFPSKQARDAALASGMEHGILLGYDQLDAMLTGL